MSKVDAQRAMREARFAAYRDKRAAAGRPTSPPTDSTAATVVALTAARQADDAVTGPAEEKAKRPRTTKGSKAVTTETVVAETATDLCGHRNMGGKSCSRPAGHAEKNHRYR